MNENEIASGRTERCRIPSFADIANEARKTVQAAVRSGDLHFEDKAKVDALHRKAVADNRRAGIAKAQKVRLKRKGRTSLKASAYYAATK